MLLTMYYGLHQRRQHSTARWPEALLCRGVTAQVGWTSDGQCLRGEEGVWLLQAALRLSDDKKRRIVENRRRLLLNLEQLLRKQNMVRLLSRP